MANQFIPPREETGGNAGVGRFGFDFSPSERYRRVRNAREKMRRVLDGNESLTFSELQTILAKALLGR